MEAGITTRRIVVNEGILHIRTSERQLQTIERIDVKQGVFARKLGYGGIVINGMGQETEFTSIPNPFEFQAKVREVIDTNAGHQKEQS